MTSTKSRPVWVGTSWKMNKTLAEADSFVDELLTFTIPSGIHPFVLPPYTALARVRDRLPTESPVLLGAQNAHWAEEGAWTGEISMRMAKDAGATLIEIGHSERREHFGETDRTVALKTAAAIAHDLIPLICVGEPLGVREVGGAEDFVAVQLQIALSELRPPDVARVIIAYEPIWAIGEHGTPPTLDQISPVMAVINDVVTAYGGGARAVLYGGSVNAANAASLLSDSGTDGLFVGRAAWEASGFIELLKLCASFDRAGGGSSTAHSRNLPWTITAAVL